eukprot:TRINITY_DN8005_c0_g1_i2.p2 TRINITY_DN8005_c0_g1~~TRINITY_DN8005_c0_g1_i2.p2  ORF type:complete len:112 (-),score=24.36 TRINITY_DN8005_c0_g1_i2:152-460(-)
MSSVKELRKKKGGSRIGGGSISYEEKPEEAEDEFKRKLRRQAMRRRVKERKSSRLDMSGDIVARDPVRGSGDADAAAAPGSTSAVPSVVIVNADSKDGGEGV